MDYLSKAGVLNPSVPGFAGALRSLWSGLHASALSDPSNSSASDQEPPSLLTVLLASARPWAEFCAPRKLSIPPSANDLRHRLMSNLPYFRYNYVIVFLMVSIFPVIIHPMSLAAVLLLAALGFYLFMGGKHSDQTTGILQDDNAKRVCFSVATCLVLWFTDAATLVGSWGLVAMLASIAHAATRPSRDEPDFESTVTETPV